MKNVLLVLVILILFSSKTIFAQNAADRLTSTWLTENKDGKIEIFKKGTQFYGKLIWAKEPNGPDGKLKQDEKNPDPKLRSQPIQGAVMLSDFVYDGDNVWKDGKIYDARSGKLYSCKLTLKDNGKVLNVRGYIGVSLLGQTTVWTRVE